MPDVIAEFGHLFLGSRLKRLAERLQNDAARIFVDAGLPVQPAQMPLLLAVERYGPMTVSAAVEAIGLSQPAVTRSLAGLLDLGLVTTSRAHRDQRHKTIALTDAGIDLLARCHAGLFPRVDAAVAELCADAGGDVLAALAHIETGLAAQSLSARIALEIIDYADEYAADFYRINAEWIAATFVLEANDRAILEAPRASILDRGGVIRLARLGGEIVGTCALIRIGDGCFELTKMAVSSTVRGRKVGEALLQNMLDEARTLGLDRLYLLTNRKCAAAIHLYEKAGFVHDAGIMRDYGARYERCDVAMSYPLGAARARQPLQAA